jgi:hypothetical protein
VSETCHYRLTDGPAVRPLIKADLQSKPAGAATNDEGFGMRLRK